MTDIGIPISTARHMSGALRDRQDAAWKERPWIPNRDGEAIERAIRQRERALVRWLREAPWRGGRSLADIVRTARRRHRESIARSRMTTECAARKELNQAPS